MKSKKVILNATVLNPLKEDEEREEIEFEIMIPETEWERLIYEGQFSHCFENVIEGYRKYLKAFIGYPCMLGFREIKGDKDE